MRMQDFFKKIDSIDSNFGLEKKELVVWCDCGKHFRNSLFIGYLFKELKALNIHGMANFKLLF